MSVDLSDKSIPPAYQEIISGGETRWLLLKYSTRDKLFLTTSGTGSIDELKSFIIRDEIQFVFYRVDELDEPNPRFALLSYVPSGTSGVLRARVLVHGRAVASQFHKAYSAMMSFSDISQITQANILKQVEHEPPPRESFDNEELYSRRTRSASGSESIDRKLPDIPPTQYAAKTVSKNAGPFKSWGNEVPPTPPKPQTQHLQGETREQRRVASDVLPRQTPKLQQTHERNATSVGSVLVKVAPRISAPPVIHRIQRLGPSLEHDPDYHARMRLELQKSREKAEQEIQEAEEEANSIPRIVKKREEYDLVEEERKRAAEKERQRWMAVRLMREEAKRKQEEEEERIRQQKRAENQARKLEAARAANERRMKAQEDLEQEEKRESEKARLRRAASKANLAKVRIEHALSKNTVKEGFIYVQPSNSVTWKRRYFELSKEAMKFYRDVKKTRLLELLDLSGLSVAVKEWDEGFEELRTIPHSFALVFNNGGEPWCFYADSAVEKNIVIGLISES